MNVIFVNYLCVCGCARDRNALRRFVVKEGLRREFNALEFVVFDYDIPLTAHTLIAQRESVRTENGKLCKIFIGNVFPFKLEFSNFAVFARGH